MRVSWRDAAHSGADGWVTQDTINIPLLAAEAAGYLVFDGVSKHGEECIALASALVFNTEGKPDLCSSFVIPKQMVIDIKHLD